MKEQQFRSVTVSYYQKTKKTIRISVDDLRKVNNKDDNNESLFKAISDRTGIDSEDIVEVNWSPDTVYDDDGNETDEIL